MDVLGGDVRVEKRLPGSPLASTSPRCLSHSDRWAVQFLFRENVPTFLTMVSLGLGARRTDHLFLSANRAAKPLSERSGNRGSIEGIQHGVACSLFTRKGRIWLAKNVVSNYFSALEGNRLFRLPKQDGLRNNEKRKPQDWH